MSFCPKEDWISRVEDDGQDTCDTNNISLTLLHLFAVTYCAENK